MNEVTIQVIRARNLSPKIINNGKSDPFYKIGEAHLITGKFSVSGCRKSQVAHSTFDPLWIPLRPSFKLSRDDRVRIEVWNKEENSEDIFRGYVCFAIKNYEEGVPTWLPLLLPSHSKNETAGDICCVITSKLKKPVKKELVLPTKEANEPSQQEIPKTTQQNKESKEKQNKEKEKKDKKEGASYPPSPPPLPSKGRKGPRLPLSISSLPPSISISFTPAPPSLPYPFSSSSSSSSSFSTISNNAPAPPPLPLPPGSARRPSSPSRIPSLSKSSSSPSISLPSPSSPLLAPPSSISSPSDASKSFLSLSPIDIRTTSIESKGPIIPRLPIFIKPEIHTISDHHSYDSSSKSPHTTPADTPRSHVSGNKSKSHIMISYQWDSKEFALRLYEALTARRFVVWMDVKGGMGTDIYQSMAEGVEGSIMFVPLLTSKYVLSSNCKRECQAATDKRKLIKPVMLERMDITGWLLACISGQLRTDFLEPSSYKETLDLFLNEVESAIPIDSTARQPNLWLYLSYSIKDKDTADIMKKILMKHNPPFTCIMSAEEKDGNLQKSSSLESKLANAKAVILLLSNNFELSDDCKNDLSLSYSHRKTIIPIVIKKLKHDYPPKDMEFALKGIESLDFVALIPKPAKHSTIYRRLVEALAHGVVSKPVTVTRSENFQIKNVGDWTENDVLDWLNYAGLAPCMKEFKAQHVDGRVLLSLREKHLTTLNIIPLHQRRFFAAISTLFNDLNWSEYEVAEWLESIGLAELTKNFFESHINGQSLLMLTKDDLATSGIKERVTQKRVLKEIQKLKEKAAKVPVKSQLYRFKILQDTLKPFPTDAKDENFRFSPENMELLRHIYTGCIEQQNEAIGSVFVHQIVEGLTQASLKKFLLTLLVVADIYHDTYPSKNIWSDINIVELLHLKAVATRILADLDNSIAEIDYILSNAHNNAEELAASLTENKNFRLTCFNYLILNNIAQRLFAIIDRLVDGVVSWTELIPSLELIIYGSTEDKFKLAVCLVDFNGDGDISNAEFHQFYKECFLPIVNFCILIKLVNLEALHKDSFLHIAYNKVFDIIDVPREPSLLNKNFTVQYSGFLAAKPDDDDLLLNIPWENTPFMWFPPGYHPHKLQLNECLFSCNVCHEMLYVAAWNCKECDFNLCNSCYLRRKDEPARNIDILLTYTGNEFKLTNFTIGGKFRCFKQSLVKNVLLWILHEKPNLLDYVKFNNFTKEKSETYRDIDKPLFITTDHENNFMAHLDLVKPRYGKYILIKLLNPFSKEELDSFHIVKTPPEDIKKGTGIKWPKMSEFASKCMVAEFIGLWGYDSAKKFKKLKKKDKDEISSRQKLVTFNINNNTHHFPLKNNILAPLPPPLPSAHGPGGIQVKAPASKLFSNLAEKYAALGSTYYEHKSSDMEELKINKFVTTFLKSARDFSDGADTISEEARNMGVKKKEVEELLNRLSFLSNVGDNPADSLLLILPIIHLFRLFYGYDVETILTKPI